jgi:hypothetical protein
MMTAFMAALGYVALWLLPPSREGATGLLFAVNAFGATPITRQ